MHVSCLSRAEIIKAANSRIKAKGLKVTTISSALSRAGEHDVKAFLHSSFDTVCDAMTQKQRLIYNALLSGDLRVKLQDKGQIDAIVVCRHGGV